ncbi:MAG: hypothetical protein GWN54_03065 [Gammaproteobacteria bacterium]|nr:hypothetical protein [Gammaproteobacteria bacterium]
MIATRSCAAIKSGPVVSGRALAASIPRSPSAWSRDPGLDGAARDRFEQTSTIGELMELHNRCFLPEAGLRLPRALRCGFAFALVLDLDRLKKISGKHDHAVGDRILCETATLLGPRP